MEIKCKESLDLYCATNRDISGKRCFFSYSSLLHTSFLLIINQMIVLAERCGTSISIRTLTLYIFSK